MIRSENFRPSPGTITDVYFPGGNGVRIDSAVYQRLYGSALVRFHAGKADRMGKGSRRSDSTDAAVHLAKIIIEGIETNVDYQYGILQDPDYCSGKFDVEFLNESGKSPASIA